jgi:hypothetical protein
VSNALIGIIFVTRVSTRTRPSPQQPTTNRQADSSAGQSSSAEDSSARVTWPDEDEIFQVGREMLTGGTGAPVAPAQQFQPGKADYTQLVVVKKAMAALKAQHGDALHLVPDTTGRIDQQEGRGYLLGALLGRGLLTREQAAAAGLDARNKLAALEKRLTVQKETARMAARRLSGEALLQHGADTAVAREAIEREQIKLDLPEPSAPPPRRLRERKRAREPEQRSEFDVPSTEAQAAALDEAAAAVKQARSAASLAVAEARTALHAKLRAELQEDAVLERCAGEQDWFTEALLLSQKECRRLDKLDEERVRAEEKAALTWLPMKPPRWRPSRQLTSASKRP